MQQAAFTEFSEPAPGKMVRFINITRQPEGDVVISLRESDGHMARIELSAEEWTGFSQRIAELS